MKIAKSTFHGPDRLTVVVGEMFEDDAEVVRKYPDRFEDLETAARRRGTRSYQARPVQSATARPGEMSQARAVQPREKKGAPAADVTEKAEES